MLWAWTVAYALIAAMAQGQYINGSYVPSPGESGPSWQAGVTDTLHRVGDLAVNAKAVPFGAVGDGIADDTAAIQAAIDAAASVLVAGVTGGMIVWLPAGTYKISNKLTIPRGVTLQGPGWTSCQILQSSNAIPILEARGTQCHSVGIKGVALKYQSNQTDPASIAISFPYSAGNTGPYYWWSIQGVQIAGAYDGIGLASATAVFFSSNIGTEAPVLFSETYRSTIRLNPSSGSPGLRFGHIYVTNPTVVPTSHAVSISAGQAWFGYLSISGWDGPILSLGVGGEECEIQQLHIESCTVSSASVGLISCLGGLNKLGQVSIALTCTAPSSGVHYLFRAINASVKLQIDQVTTSIVNSGTGVVHRFSTDNPGTTEVMVTQWRDLLLATDAPPGTATNYQSLTDYLGSRARRVFALTDGSLVTPSNLKGNYLTLAAAGSRTIAAPQYPWSGAELTFDVLNNTGGAIATVWNAVFKLAAAWVDPAAGKRRKIQFTYDGTNWVEDFRSGADI